MNDHAGLKRFLIRKAHEKYGNIQPCGDKKTLHNCFTVMQRDGKPHLVLWFNIVGGSTQTMWAKIRATH